MFVSADRVLGVAIGVAQARLVNLARDGSLSETSRHAYRSGMDHLLRVGPLGDLPGASRLVRVQLLDPVYRDDVMTIGMRWEAIGATGGLFPVLDADIKLSGGPGQDTRLALSGCYRPPFGVLGAALNRMLLHTVAELTLRSVLASFAMSIESPVPAAGHEAAAWQRETGPQIAPG
jgi:hypothetical protein